MGTTTNYGFRTPDSPSHVRLWEHFEALGDDVDAFLAASVLHGYSNFTSAWTATGTAPAVGNAVRVSRYRQLGDHVQANSKITFGSTTTFGTGAYGFSLPVPAANPAVGSAYLRDTSAAAAGHFVGICVVDPALSATVVNLFVVNTQAGQTVPFTMANTDHLTWSLDYEAA